MFPIPFHFMWSIGQVGRNRPTDVAAAQVLLNLAAKPGTPPLPVDGKLTAATLEALRTFQTKSIGFSQPTVSVEPGSTTIRALIAAAIPRARQIIRIPTGKGGALTESDYQSAAQGLGCEVAAVKAVAAVESAGRGFLPSGQPKILFEAKVFSTQTGGKYDGLFPDISAPKLDRSLYQGGIREYHRLQKAMLLNRTAGLQAASWGKFQILGLYCKLAGYHDVESFVSSMCQSEGKHLDAFCAFVRSKRIVDALRTHDWATFAEAYNGKGYKEKHYDRRIKEEFDKASRPAHAVSH